jgi:hypothetical protein
MKKKYSLESPDVYSAEQELHVRADDPKAQHVIRQAQEKYNAFASDFRGRFDLSKPASILDAYAEAMRRDIFGEAARVRDFFFGRDMHFYGVVYLWDMCMESCTYCPAAVENRKKAKYKPLDLTIEDAVRDVKYVMADGHRHLCILTGEDPLKHPPELLAEYIRAFDELGLTEMILNVEPPKDPAHFRLWRDAAKKTSLQFRIFQETYDRETYAAIHPVTKWGRKHDFDNRYDAQIVAMQHGFDNYGLGILFGNHPRPIDEIDGLAAHARYALGKTGKWPARVNLPSAKHLENIEVEIPFDLHMSRNASSGSSTAYRMSSELIYALTRLALPHISIVSSERDSPELLRVLDRYATCTTLNVHPGVGDNIRFNEGIDFMTAHFEQAPSFSRDPRTLALGYAAAGYRAFLGPITNSSIHERKSVARTVNLKLAA